MAGPDTEAFGGLMTLGGILFFKENMKEELIEMGGVVVDKQPNAFFKVQINDTDHMVLATISGRMRRNRIRILMGDRVDIELSPYDLTKGRITYRHK
jgi:translation initiation factor IF-1